MKISQIYQYPIKALRPSSTPSATITAQGFKYDRRYMLLHVQPDGSFKNVHVAHYPEATLFTTSMTEPAGDDDRGTITITYNPPQGNLNGKPDAPATLTIPLVPDMTGLKQLEILMHRSPTRAYDMGPEYATWFSKYFGFQVVLAYLGPYGREVLMSLGPDRPVQKRDEQGNSATPAADSSTSWLSSITSSLPSVPLFGWLGGYLRSAWAGGVTRVEPGSKAQHPDAADPELTFADCAPYLVVSEKSLDELSSRIPGDYQVDVTKFRPNIIIEGCALPWDEDFWGELSFETDSSPSSMTLVHNCARCPSINIDYKTGAPGKGNDGLVLKAMQKDRRVDKGAKWNPVFGRYGFTPKADTGKRVRVGGDVHVVRRIEERTRFDWPGIYGN
ncbi:hypothetical protein BKA81DRAFT_406318 [Phyllosticta paracitricarpa]|uniref:MOSC domain protein n=1 Tax=Phyllosticta paracitricarpa TaxID=2016321 RepID=A0ABR1N2X8_9PEZI